MSDGSIQDRASLLRERILLAQNRRAESALQPFRPFLTALAEQVAEALQTVSSAPVKCSVLNAIGEVLSSDVLLMEGRRFSSARGELRSVIKTDSQFEALSCEICFGGVGASHSVDDGQRPSSKIERRLRELIVKEIFTRVPKAVQAMADLPMTLIELDGPPKNKPPASDVHCMAVTVLVNAFSLSTEITCLFPQSEIEHLLAVHVVKEPKVKRHARQVLSACPFEMTAYLPAEQIPLNLVMALQPGSVLELSAKPTDLVTLKMGGREITQANFEVRSSGIALAIA